MRWTIHAEKDSHGRTIDASSGTNRDEPPRTISSGHIESCFHSFDIAVIIGHYHILKSSLSKKNLSISDLADEPVT